jgi:glycolate oxidase
MSAAGLANLKQLLRPDQILTQPEDLIPYSFDGTANIAQLAAAVIFPDNAAQIAQILQTASREKIPVVTRGSGTGLSGGSVPTPGSIVLCLVKLDKILEIDSQNLTITVEPGVLTQSIADAAQAAGLFYPPDPGSIKISTIGGNVAENSGGLRGLKYGVTRDYVMALEVVLSNGQIVSFGTKCVKDVAGYSMKDLFIGSEGTLGVITKITLKLIPAPKARQTLLAVYDSMEAAAATVSAIIEAKIIPCTLEFLDRVTLACVEEYAHVGLPLDAEAVLLAETDGHPATVAEEAAHMEELAQKHGARSVQVAQSAADAEKLKTARRSAFAALARVAPTTILEDATVPRSELVKMVRHIQQVGNKYKLKIGTFGHMGDGNLHPTFLTNEKNADEMHRVEQAMREIFDCAISLGGTITGEHGVGLAKKTFLPRMLGDSSMELLKTVKKAFDPDNILNPGKIF